MVALAGAVAWLFARTRLAASRSPMAAATAPLPSVPPPPSGVTISLLYGTEKRKWLEDSAAEFVKARPEIHVELTGMGSLESAQALLEGKRKSILWSPADSGVLALLQSDWRLKYGTDPFVGGD